VPFVEYRTYGGIHGEDYCLDNIICWAKMILEFFLYTRDDRWVTAEKLSAVEESTDYIINHMRTRSNPSLVETGVEGDWTENTDWNADNSNTNACLIHCLSLLVETERALGHKAKVKKYEVIKEEIRQNFNPDIHKGGFWYIHSFSRRKGFGFMQHLRFW